MGAPSPPTEKSRSQRLSTSWQLGHLLQASCIALSAKGARAWTEREERERESERGGNQRETFVHQLFGLNVLLLTDGAPRVVLILEGVVAGQ